MRYVRGIARRTTPRRSGGLRASMIYEGRDSNEAYYHNQNTPPVAQPPIVYRLLEETSWYLSAEDDYQMRELS